ncbi:hypothetical protein [Alteriqipengyuania lutimaris]|uniref:Uncharacterized protein n=1 Tax=Alteriqipengyuania lutimaris TaxID=1538146 RepID=A0A395LI86_9SPHN|nr:hypothetical protein [Alteriqipengyuania lutimaris]MBB3034521.1 hypothetical protein [Alteriqipengyuania lutimaris]RDS76592.1 hypothetical protein DL238_02550 [Alteriqipengyuania lutimaris]
MDPQLVQFGGSLAAILVLAGIAWALKLGHPPRIESEEHATALGCEADTAFVPERAAVCEGGAAAILVDAAGRVMVLRRHGVHFAARVLEPGAGAQVEDGALTVVPTDRTYGPVTLQLGEHAQTWAARVDGVSKAHDA